MAGPARSITIRRAARHHEAIAKRPDQSAPAGTGPGRQPEIHLRNVDDHPVGVGECKGAKLNRLVEIQDETGLLGVAGQSGVGGYGVA